MMRGESLSTQTYMVRTSRGRWGLLFFNFHINFIEELYIFFPKLDYNKRILNQGLEKPSLMSYDHLLYYDIIV